MTTSAAAPRTVRKDALRNRELLLESADALIREHGLELSLNAVARHAGVGVGTVYRHFPDREALIGAMFEQRVEQIEVILSAHVFDEDPVAGLIAAVLEICEMQCGDRGIWSVVSSGNRDSHRETVQARVLPLTERLVARANATGRLRSRFETTDLPVTVWTSGALDGYLGEVSPAAWRRYVRLLLNGFLTDDDPARTALRQRALTVDEIDVAMGRSTPFDRRRKPKTTSGEEPVMSGRSSIASRVQAHEWWRELLLVGVLYLTYAASRLASPLPAAAALTNGHRVLDFERRLHIAPEHTLNDLLYDAPRWLSVVSAYFYETMHYVVTVAMLVWLYRTGEDAYRRARNWLVAMTFPALIVFWAFPVSPPRSTPGAVAHDIVAEQSHYGWWGSGGGTAPSGLGGLVNDHAAMPSLHVGWALWAGWNLVHSARNRYVRAAGYVYPFITAFVVLSTGNHYLVDVLAGVALSVGAKLVVDHVTARRLHPIRVSWTIVRRWAVVAAAVTLVSLDVHLLSPYIDQAASALSHPVLWWAVAALLAEVVSLFASAHLQRGMLRASGTRVRMPTAVGMTYAAYAMSMSLPAGPAVSAGYTFRRLRQLGATPPTAGFTLVSSAAPSMLAYGLLAVTGFTLAGGSSGGPVAVVAGLVAGVSLVLLGRAALRHPEFVERAGLRVLRRINRVRHRAPDAGTPELRRSTRLLAAIHPRGRDWAAGLGAALVNWVADFACLYASCQAVGANGSTVVVVLVAYLSGTSVSGISLVPGGLGVVDAALVLVLVRNGVGAAPAAAAVLLYRASSFGFGALAGWTSWFGHTRSIRRVGAAGPSSNHSSALSTTAPVGPGAPSACSSIAGAGADHLRLPGRSCVVAGRDRHVAVARRGRHPSAVRR